MRSLCIAALLGSYRRRELKPSELIEEILPRVAADDRNAWITRLSAERVREYARALDAKTPDDLPLYGIPFAIKDNIDLADTLTTVGCPEFAYVPGESATVVDKLIKAGAIPIGKTNLDQFAAGLSGARSPYGAGRNSFDPAFISGGSSSGSAITVATGQVSFALGTDTAGSGRVPAAFNNLVGLKPSCGRLSSRGVFPACRSLDCISIFALTSDDAARVLAIAEGYDEVDPYSRAFAPASLGAVGCARVPFTFGVPRARDLEFFGDQVQAQAFIDALRILERLGGTAVEIDFEPFFATAKLLYEGPWLAERYAALADFVEARPEALHPVTREIISKGKHLSAVECFKGQYELMMLKRATEAAWSNVDVLVTPSAGAIYSIEQMMADPIRLNTNLGRYTNFVNLLDLSAIAVPTGFRSDGLPFGVTLVGRAGADSELLMWAERVQRVCDLPLGATGIKTSNTLSLDSSIDAASHINIAVCGAHMRGLALNHELTDRYATLVSRTVTAPRYRLYALAGGAVRRPGLVRIIEGGAALELEIWSMPSELFGSFIKNVPAPLAIGKVETETGEWVAGFVCENYAVSDATDITAYGGWRAFVAAQR
jgi:allophanate hydrolase